MFAKPDYYVQTGSTTCTNATGSSGSDCVDQNTGYAWDHGDYAAEINTNYIGIVGPGVANLGLDGPAANAGPNSAGANSGQTTVVESDSTGTWTDETDIQPTLMYLTGLRDDYIPDGRVITEIMTKRFTANFTRLKSRRCRRATSNSTRASVSSGRRPWLPTRPRSRGRVPVTLGTSESWRSCACSKFCATNWRPRSKTISTPTSSMVAVSRTRTD